MRKGYILLITVVINLLCDEPVTYFYMAQSTAKQSSMKNIDDSQYSHLQLNHSFLHEQEAEHALLPVALFALMTIRNDNDIMEKVVYLLHV